MRRKSVTYALAMMLASMLDIGECSAWKSNYPSGPVRPIPSRPIAARLIGPSDVGLGTVPLSSILSDRKVPYPSSQGVDLGAGWDMIRNAKKPIVCVEFEEVSDSNYQNVDFGLQEVSDEDTLDIGVNAQFSAQAGGDIEGVYAKADATSTLNASHHVASKDITFTARASVSSGIRFTGPTGPTKTKSVRLTSEMHKLAIGNMPEFERQCGHGYVHSIGNGADLYLLFHFHELETKDRLELTFDSHASASMVEVFEAGGSSKLATTIERLSREKKLDLSFVQLGGKPDKLPLTLADAKDQVQKLAAQEFSNPRRIYIMVQPYSSLSNFPNAYFIETSDLRQRAVRYINRLNSVIFEARNIRENLYRDRSDTATADQYYYYFRHQLRSESPSDMADRAAFRRQATIDALEKLNGPLCQREPFASTPAPAGLSRQDREAFEAERKQRLKLLSTAYGECKKVVDDLLIKTENLEDLGLWAGLPVPLNTLTTDTIAKLDNTSGDPTARRQLYAQAIYRHWIERQDQIRCRLLIECLSGDEMTSYYKDILTNLKGITAPIGGKPNAIINFCIAEENSDCESGAVGLNIQRNFGCSFNSRDQEAGVIICKEREQYSAGARRIKTDDPYKQCGRSISNVECYSYAEQPVFPRGP